MRLILALSFLLFSGLANASEFSEKSCAQYAQKADFHKALTVVANNMKYTTAELCSLPHLADIHIANRNFYTEQGEPIPHVWVTLHYAEHSCQYFVRNADWLVTKKNCYNTW